MHLSKPLVCLVAAFVVSIGTNAQKSNAVFYCGRTVPYSIAFERLNTAEFRNSDKTLDFELSDGRTATFALNGLDSICFPARSVSATPIPQPLSIVPDSFCLAQSYSQEPEPDYKSMSKDDPRLKDYFEDYTPSKYITITYSETGATISGSAKNVVVTKKGAHVTASDSAGHVQFRLKGKTGNGSFTLMDNSDNKRCHIILDGANITNPDGPAINLQSGKEVYIRLSKDSISTLTDGSTYVSVEGEDRKSALFSEGPIIISGTGELKINASGGHGICSDDYIRFRQGTGKISIVSAHDGINAKDGVIMYGGNISIGSQDDGIQVRRGSIDIYGGTIDITSQDQGLLADYAQADTAYVNIAGGLVRSISKGEKGHGINSFGNISVSKNATLMFKTEGLGSKCIKSDNIISIDGCAWLWNTADHLAGNDDTAKSRAISAGKDITLSKNCTLYVCAKKTGLFANGGLTMDGAHIFLSAGDKEKCLNIKGSTVWNSGLAVIQAAEQ